MKSLKLLFLLFAGFVFSQNKISPKILVPYRDGNLWGLADTLGVVKVKPFADDIPNFSVGKKGGKYVIKKGGKLSVITDQKKILMPENTKYDSLAVSSDYDEVATYKAGKNGIFKNSKELIAPIYDRIQLEENGSYEVEKDDMHGLVNSKGVLIIPTEYRYISASYEDSDKNNPQFVWVAKGVFSDKKFYDTRIPPKLYEGPIPTEGNSVIVYDGDNFKKKRDSLRKILLKNYDDATFDRDLESAVVKKNGLFGFYDITNRKELIPTLYSSLEEVRKDHDVRTFLVSKDGKFGFVKEGNKIFMPIEYDNIEYFRWGMYLLEKNGKKGLQIFNTIYPRIEPKYLKIKRIEPIQVNNNWQFGLFEVINMDGKKGLIGENGVEFFKN